MPCVASPYHYRVDWQIWFAAMGSYHHNPWLIRLIYKLLSNDPLIVNLIGYNPFQGMDRPKYIRVLLFEYKFTHWSSKDWWTRSFLREYFPPLSLDNPTLREFNLQYQK